MSDLHRVADVIANTISLGGDPLDVARELDKRGMLASSRSIVLSDAAFSTNNYLVQANMAAPMQTVVLNEQNKTEIEKAFGVRIHLEDS